jgi:hypothetical protein
MTPFFTFAMALVIPGALVILLAALLLTRGWQNALDSDHLTDPSKIAGI